MRYKPATVTAETVQRVNERRIALRKSGLEKPMRYDFLGQPIRATVKIDQDAWKRAWKIVHERSVRA